MMQVVQVSGSAAWFMTPIGSLAAHDFDPVSQEAEEAETPETT